MKISLHFLLLCFSVNAYCQQRLVKVKEQYFNIYTKGFENRKEGTPVLLFENGMGVDAFVCVFTNVWSAHL